MKPFIQINNVTFSYKDGLTKKEADLSDITLSIEAGEFVALIGQNGSGKSTLGKLLNALLLPLVGDIFVEGKNTKEEANHPDIRAQVGMIFQKPQDQIVASIVEEEVAFGPANLGLPPDEIGKRVAESLAVCGLSNFRSRLTYQLSAGETQRVALAGVLAMRPKCVIFDETTAMLDPAGRRMVMEQVKKLHGAGITVIFITHLMEEAVQAERILVLHQGCLVMDGRPEQVFLSRSQLKKFGLDLPSAVLASNSLRNFFKSLPENLLFEQDLLHELQKYPFMGEMKPSEDARSSPPNDMSIDVNELGHVYMRGTPLAHSALKNCSLRVGKKTTYGLVGSTGSGKSTLLQHLNGLLKPQTGTIRVLDFDLNDPNVDLIQLRQSVGLVFQQPEDQLFEQYVGDEIAYAVRNFGVPGKISEIVFEAMQSVGLDFDTFKDRLTITLSGGECRKVALASVIAAQPKILLLDEPLAGLDPQSRADIAAYLAEIKKSGKTLLISTHQFEDMMDLLDEISILSDGHDLSHGKPGDVFSEEHVLSKTGVEPPLIVKIVLLLREMNWPISKEIVTLPALERVLSSIINPGDRG